MTRGGARLAEVLERHPPTAHTSRTLTKLTALRREVARIRRLGYSVDNEEYHAGVRCLAAPVRASDGAVVAALGITAATVRFPPGRIAALAAVIQRAAAELGRGLGHAGATA